MIQSEDDDFKEARDRLLIERTKIENEEYLKDLIANLESTHKEWQKTLQELKEQKEQYNKLIEEVKKIKKIVVDDALKSNISNKSKFKIRILSRNKKEKK